MDFTKNNYLFRVWAFLVSVLVFLVSIRCSSVQAFEISAENEAQITNMIELGETNLNAISASLDINDNGLSLKLEALGMQDNFLSFCNDMYIGSGWDINTNSFSIGSDNHGFCGFYRNSADNKYYRCSLYSTSHTICNAEHFMFQLYNVDSEINVGAYHSWANKIGDFLTTRSGSYVPFGIRDTIRGLSWSGSVNVNNSYEFVCRYDSTSIPTVNVSSVTAGSLVCGGSREYTMPSGSVDVNQPWLYYNNVLIPTLIDMGIDADLFIFPDGYIPNTDPVEPPDVNIPITPVVPLTGVFIGGLFVYAPISGTLEVDGVDISFPVDNSVQIGDTVYNIPTGDIPVDGHVINFSDDDTFSFDGITFVINPDGSITIDGNTYTFPIVQPVTVPAESYYIDYQWEVPTFDTFYLPDDTVDISVVSLAPDISGIWGFLRYILTLDGAFPYLPLVFGLSFVGFMLYKVGGS